MGPHATAVVEDLRARGAMTERLGGELPPQDWREAAQNARCL